MKKITAVRITNATATGQVLISIVYDDNGTKSTYNQAAIITTDTVTGEKEYHADTKERDAEMKDFIKNAIKTEKTDGNKWAYYYK